MSCSRSELRSVDETGEPTHIFRPKSFSLSVVNWFHVAGLYVPYVLTAALVCAFACLLPPIELPPPNERWSFAVTAASAARDAALNATPSSAYQFFVDGAQRLIAQITSMTSHVTGLWYAYLVIVFWIYWALSSKPPVYIVDFSVYEPPREWRVSRQDLVEIWRRHNVYTEESLAFMANLLAKSGTGDRTHWPPGTTRLIKGDTVSLPTSSVLPIFPPGASDATKPDISIAAARAVAEEVLCNCFQQVLDRTGYRPRDVGILIVNCSLFAPTPSLAAIVAHRFSLKTTCRTYNLGGMGCSASIIAIDLAKELLQNNSNTIAVVLSTEEITQSMYLGNERALLVQNTLFRVGGAGILLSNKPTDGFRAKYKLLHTVRTQDNSEAGHRVVYQCEDSRTNLGCALGKDITKVAGKALLTNFTILGPRVLPIREQLRAIASYAHRWFVKNANSFADSRRWKSLPFASNIGGDAQVVAQANDGSVTPDAKAARAATQPGRYALPAQYVPDFKRAVQHFCIHAGGRAVIDGIEENLKLERWQTAPSRATLYHWGNTSSSSIWYELRYCEGENDSGELFVAAKAADETAGDPAAPAVASKAATATRAPARGKAAASRSSTPSGKKASRSSTPKALSVKAAGGPDPDAEATANGWDADQKWTLPEYRGRTVRVGDRIVQIAFGAGFKCNSAVLLALKTTAKRK